jgi:hypothetical protein
MVKAGYNGRLHGQVTFPPAETEFLKNGISIGMFIRDRSGHPSPEKAPEVRAGFQLGCSAGREPRSDAADGRINVPKSFGSGTLV